MVIVKVFVSGPGDVDDLKADTKRLCAEVNRDKAEEMGISLVYLDGTMTVPLYGPNAQSLIDTQFADYDVYIGMFCTKLGTPTGVKYPDEDREYESGTVQEFDMAYRNYDAHGRPKMSLFFINPKVDSPTLEDLTKIGEVLKFKERIGYKPHKWVSTVERDELVDEVRRLLHARVSEKQHSMLSKQEIPVDSVQYRRKHTQYFQAIAEAYNVAIENHLQRKVALHTSLHPASSYNRDTTVSPLQLIAKGKKTVVLGDAGSGKSTELHILAGALLHDEAGLVPIHRPLKHYDPSVELEDFLFQGIEPIDLNGCVVLLDGLDETATSDLLKVVRRLNNFAEKHRDAIVVVTCRRNFYDLPGNGAPGTLVKFDTYFVVDVRPSDAQEYYARKYASESESVTFIEALREQDLLDLVGKPFFLNIAADTYHRNKKLSDSKAGIIKDFLHRRLILDIGHFKNAIDLRGKQVEILTVLQNVAFVMEMLGRNYLAEEELLRVVTSAEYELLKHCTMFKKNDRDEQAWHFEHNNVQEYLAALLLSQKPFEMVVRLLTFEPQHRKLIPTWVNTVTFLFSIADQTLTNGLLDWLTVHERDLVVKLEHEKIAASVRNDIFKAIFERYKTHDLNLHSSTFNERELARFAQSRESVDYLLHQIVSDTTETVKLNAIHLLGYFKFDREAKHRVKTLIVGLLGLETKHDFLHTCLYTLRCAGIDDVETVREVLSILGNRTNQHIRSALYSLIGQHHADEFVDFLLESFEVDSADPDRDGVHLINEHSDLINALSAVQRPHALKKIIDYLKTSRHFEYDDKEQLVSAVVANGIKTFSEDDTLFDAYFSWLEMAAGNLQDQKVQLLLPFFRVTQTTRRALDKAHNLPADANKTKQLVIAALLTPGDFAYIGEKVAAGKMDAADVQQICYAMGWVGTECRDEFGTYATANLGVAVPKNEQINDGPARKAKAQSDFDLLFHPNEFKRATLEIFEEEGKDEFTINELFELRKEQRKHYDWGERYPSTSVDLLRRFDKKGVTKQRVIDWFARAEAVECCCVGTVYNRLSHDQAWMLTDAQKEWVKAWCYKTVEHIDFTKAITVDDNGGRLFNIRATFLAFFSSTLDFDYSAQVMLDMLSFEHFVGLQPVGIERLIAKLPEPSVRQRILENLNRGIREETVLKNHVRYAAAQKLTEAYPAILRSLLDNNHKGYVRTELIDIYFHGTSDVDGLWLLLPRADEAIHDHVVNLLSEHGDKGALGEYLLQILADDAKSQSDKLSAAKYLVKLQRVEGVRFISEWMKQNQDQELNRNDTRYIDQLQTPDAIPLLLDMLETNFRSTKREDRFDTLESYLLAGLYNIALTSDSNFERVTKALREFREEKLNVHKDVKYLLNFIERIETQFYANKAQLVTLTNAIAKLKSLS